MLLELTDREIDVYKLFALGYSLEEIGDLLFISPETVRKHISNIKIKLKLQKATELVAFYWLENFGDSLESKRKQIISTLLIALFFWGVPPFEDKRINRSSRKNQRIEISARGRREYI